MRRLTWLELVLAIAAAPFILIFCAFIGAAVFIFVER
jgi:hypothetical protein